MFHRESGHYTVFFRGGVGEGTNGDNLWSLICLRLLGGFQLLGHQICVLVDRMESGLCVLNENGREDRGKESQTGRAKLGCYNRSPRMALWTNYKLVLNEVKGYGDNSKANNESLWGEGHATRRRCVTSLCNLTGTGISLIGLRSTIDLGVGKHSISHAITTLGTAAFGPSKIDGTSILIYTPETGDHRVLDRRQQ